jgi:class 3 adenylate cyclase
MEAPTLDRRLVAILAADVEGYSRLMALDEEAALATLSAHRAIADELIVGFHGRIANTAGDSVLAEFASIVDAVRCAMEIQGKIAAANDELPEARRMLFRIGINVGDVMVKNGDIFGDGVNVAARLQTLADAGDICVSRGVRDSLRHLAGFSFEDLGEQVVKNIARPVRAFRVTIDPEAAADAPEETVPPQPPGIPTEPRADESAALDLAMWETVSDSNDVDVCALLRSGMPHRVAPLRIVSISAAASSWAAAPPLALWDEDKRRLVGFREARSSAGA